jgi:hypothetical protein
MSTVRCFACKEMGHYAGQCPKKKKKQQDVSAVTIEELELDEQFARECAFSTTLSVVTPSSIRWGDKVEEDLLTHSSDSEGAQAQFSWTPSSGVTGPPRSTQDSFGFRDVETKVWCRGFRASKIDEEERQGTTEA